MGPVHSPPLFFLLSFDSFIPPGDSDTLSIVFSFYLKSPLGERLLVFVGFVCLFGGGGCLTFSFSVFPLWEINLCFSPRWLGKRPVWFSRWKVVPFIIRSFSISGDFSPPPLPYSDFYPPGFRIVAMVELV